MQSDSCSRTTPQLEHGIQVFLHDILDDTDENFLDKRRKLLRQRAGLTDKDSKKVQNSDYEHPNLYKWLV